MRIKKLRFAGGQGHALGAILNLPREGEPRAYALFAHCFTCGKDIRAAHNISQALCARGLGVLRFDFTGLGESEGDFTATGFASNVEDLLAAARFMAAELKAPRLLVGHSLGGTAAILAAGRIAACRAVAAIASPASLAGMAQLLAGRKQEIRETGSAEVNVAGRLFRIGRPLLEDIEQDRVRQEIAGLDRALLLLHAPEDPVVPIERAAEIFRAASHPKSFVSLAGADHLLSRDEDSGYAGEVIAAWAGRYLESAG